LTRAVTIIALTCFLVVGAAATSILGRDSAPAARPEMALQVAQNPVSNKEGKKDKLAVVSFALASFEPAQPPADLSEPLRQAFAAQAPAQVPAEIAAPRAVTPQAMPAAPLAPQVSKTETPKPAVRSAPQKSYALLSDAQIAGIKQRLALSPDQESYWPAVETALRAVAHKIHASRRADPHATGAPIDPDCAEVQQLKSAAMPLLFQLREDQKREVRSLARLIGLEKVAAQI
jgi:ABC-type transporter Mla MlaB component